MWQVERDAKSINFSWKFWGKLPRGRLGRKLEGNIKIDLEWTGCRMWSRFISLLRQELGTSWPDERILASQGFFLWELRCLLAASACSKHASEYLFISTIHFLFSSPPPFFWKTLSGQLQVKSALVHTNSEAYTHYTKSCKAGTGTIFTSCIAVNVRGSHEPLTASRCVSISMPVRQWNWYVLQDVPLYVVSSIAWPCVVQRVLRWNGTLSWNTKVIEPMCSWKAGRSAHTVRW
jgi:hypothetical protein